MSIKKKRAITKFIIMGILCLIMILGSFLSFALPNSDSDFVGFINSLNTPLEFRGGTVLTYEVSNTNQKSTDTKQGVVAYEYQIKANLARYNYNVAVSSYYGGNGKYIMVLNLLDSYDGDSFYGSANEQNTVTSIINNEVELEFKAEQSLSAEAKLTGVDLASVQGLYYAAQDTYGVNITFTPEGQVKFKNLTSSISSSGSGSIYIYIGGSLFTSINVQGEMDQQSVFISGNMTNLAQANEYASKMNAARFSLDFTKVGEKIVTKEEARVNSIMTIGIFVVTLIILTAVMYALFKKFGLVSSFVMLMATLTYIILLQAIPGIMLTTTSIPCMLLPLLFGYALSLYMLNNMKKEFALGKKIPASISFGFSKSYVKMLDFAVLAIIPAVVLMIVGTATLNSIAYVISLGILIFTFFAIVINKWFAGWYVNINSKQNNDYGFKREAHINELA